MNNQINNHYNKDVSNQSKTKQNKANNYARWH